MAFNRRRLRQLHRWFAPIMVLPLILTLLTGSLYQVAVLTGEVQDFLWLLDLHTGKFGALDLQFIYPFLNAFGILILAVTGITMWWQLRPVNNR
ncbi:MAG: PepSY domain-containing protein [Halothece sp.]